MSVKHTRVSVMAGVQWGHLRVRQLPSCWYANLATRLSPLIGIEDDKVNTSKKDILIIIQPTFPTPSDTLKLVLTAFDATNLTTENLNHIATLFNAIQDTAQQHALAHIAALAGIGRFLADEYYALCVEKNLQLDQHISRFQTLDMLD